MESSGAHSVGWGWGGVRDRMAWTTPMDVVDGMPPWVIPHDEGAGPVMSEGQKRAFVRDGHVTFPAVIPRELLATAGAKMERFMQAREEAKLQLLTNARRLAARMTITWFVVAWGLILTLWKAFICGVIDADASAEGSGSADEVAIYATPCVHAAQDAYQCTRPFFTIGPALFAITDWDIDAAARNSPNKLRLVVTLYFWIIWATGFLVLPLKALPFTVLAMVAWVYFIIFSGPIIRERAPSVIEAEIS